MPTRDLPHITKDTQLKDAIFDQIRAQQRTVVEVSETAGYCRGNLYGLGPRKPVCQEMWIRYARALGCKWVLRPDTRLVTLNMGVLDEGHSRLLE